MAPCASCAARSTRAFGINQLDLLAGFAGPQHDEVESAQEEVYVVLAGSGTLALDGEHDELRPGRFVRVAPSVSRQLTAGPDGLTIIAIGAPLGGGYQPRGPFSRPLWKLSAVSHRLDAPAAR